MLASLCSRTLLTLSNPGRIAMTPVHIFAVHEGHRLSMGPPGKPSLRVPPEPKSIASPDIRLDTAGFGPAAFGPPTSPDLHHAGVQLSSPMRYK